MDQYQCRGKLIWRTLGIIGPYELPQEMVWTNDWSIWISHEIGMDQWRSKFSESFSLDRYWSTECSSLDNPGLVHTRVWLRNKGVFPGFCPSFCSFEGSREITVSGLAIYAARGLRSGIAENTAVAFTACGGWQFFWKMRCGNRTSSRWHQMAKTGVRKKSVSMRKLKLWELNADSRVMIKAFHAAIPRQKPFAEKTAVTNASGSGRRKWPTERVKTRAKPRYAPNSGWNAFRFRQHRKRVLW